MPPAARIYMDDPRFASFGWLQEGTRHYLAAEVRKSAESLYLGPDEAAYWRVIRGLATVCQDGEFNAAELYVYKRFHPVQWGDDPFLPLFCSLARPLQQLFAENLMPA